MAKRRGGYVATQDFSIKFDGPALAEGRMPVGELAPALLALGDLFQQAKEIVEPDAPPIHLEVRAFGRGSFDALLGITATVVTALSSDPVAATSNLMTVVTHGKTGVLAALKALRGLAITKMERVGAQYRVYNQAGNSFVAPNATINVYNNYTARESATRVVKPLTRSRRGEDGDNGH